MNYNTLSDFEINKRVADALGCEVVYTDSIRVGIRGTQTGNPLVVDYCNNPADAWPVIEDNHIEVRPARVFDLSNGTSEYTGIWECYGFHNTENAVLGQDKNPLRAAMICFLIMKESENE